ncbi:MAG: polysaccharide deacetylase family protein [Caldilinea sp.]|nr:polysaccharide deacetylase family protein [Caldilinea sp.]MDW8442533.1 polysaccharide deacetylase family protein [Caldilineaceae bacterium]
MVRLTLQLACCCGVVAWLALGPAGCRGSEAPTDLQQEITVSSAMTLPPATSFSTPTVAVSTVTAEPASGVEASTASATPSPTSPSLLALLPTPTPTPELTQFLHYAPTPDGTARTMRVPILMYHYLSEPPPDADAYRRDLSVSPAQFAEHLDRMLAEGYTTVSLYQVVDALQRGVLLPDKPVVITFDDGYRDNYENAFPLLRERGMVATIFVITDFMDEQRPAYLTWDMAREMLAAGISIESHGRNHVSLAGKDDDYLVWQALGSLETIEYELGVRPRFISYPAGEYDQRTIDIFKSAHYWAGVTTRQGATLDNQRLFELPRVRVRNTTTADELMRLLSLDW